MPYIDDLNLRQFRTVEAIEALPRPIDMGTFKNWTLRVNAALLLDKDDEDVEISGKPILLHMRHVQQLALVSELVGMGLPPRRAGLMAAGFTNVGYSRRRPGELFRGGSATFLIADSEEKASVKKLAPTTPISSLFQDAGVYRVGIVALWVDPVVAHLRRHFELPELVG